MPIDGIQPYDTDFARGRIVACLSVRTALHTRLTRKSCRFRMSCQAPARRWNRNRSAMPLPAFELVWRGCRSMPALSILGQQASKPENKKH